MSTTPTPRTDAVQQIQPSQTQEALVFVVGVEFARQLETELAAMTMERDELKKRLTTTRIKTPWPDEVIKEVEALELKHDIETCSSTHCDQWITRCEKALADKATLVEALKNIADAGADNMEGEDARGFEYWEGHMKFCTDLLQKVGVNYNPITGETSPKH